MEFAQSCVGVVGLLLLAWAIGENRRSVDVKRVAIGLVLQIALTAILLKAPWAKAFFQGAGYIVDALQRATQVGTSFVFGYLGGAPLPFEESRPGSAFVFAFRALPLIMVISALTALLTYWRVLPWLVRGFSTLLERSLKIGGAVGLSTSANVFVGMVEAPLFIRPYITKLSRSELFIVMVGGMAGTAGTVLALYASILGPLVPGAAGHLVAASVLTAPTAIIISRIMIPAMGPETSGQFVPHPEADSAIDAITKGTSDGIALLINVIGMLVVLVSLVALLNECISLLPHVSGAPITLQRLCSPVFMPIAWMIGVPWSEAGAAGALLGTKTVLNEFLAYLEMIKAPPEALSDRSRLLMTYALCGFANFGGLGIMLGGLVAMAPERRAEIVGLGGKSLFAGMLATCLTAAIVGLFV
jgi:CNT family concentrative nucleoside transporter